MTEAPSPLVEKLARLIAAGSAIINSWNRCCVLVLPTVSSGATVDPAVASRLPQGRERTCRSLRAEERLNQGTLDTRSYCWRMSRRSRQPQRKARPTEVVMVVEAHVLVRAVVADCIRECGFKVYEATSAAEALEMLRAGHKVNVLLSDAGTSEPPDGFALAQQIRQEFPAVEIVLTNGLPMMVQKVGELCERAPLKKPYEHEQMLNRLELLSRTRGPTRLK